MTILAIDTSCDETSAAVVKNQNIISNVISSQVDLHKKWGGVVPDIARRAHTENIDLVVKEALSRARCKESDIDYFAATYGPGLAIALEIGLKKAQSLAIQHKKPFIPVNHMEGHLLSSFALNSKGSPVGRPDIKDMPMIGLLVSGGHTELILIKGAGDYTKLGETLDDAAGEAFDKVATMLELGYPGGPIISEFAKKGSAGRFSLPIPMEKSPDLNFSYSGLKTACLYKITAIREGAPAKDAASWVNDFCADFVESVVQSLVVKLEAAVDQYPVSGVLLGGGVISNTHLRSRIRAAMRKRNIPLYYPFSPKLFTDNAAMIGVAAFHMIGRRDPAVKQGAAISLVDRNPIAEIGNEV